MPCRTGLPALRFGSLMGCIRGVSLGAPLAALLSDRPAPCSSPRGTSPRCTSTRLPRPSTRHHQSRHSLRPTAIKGCETSTCSQQSAIYVSSRKTITYREETRCQRRKLLCRHRLNHSTAFPRQPRQPRLASGCEHAELSPLQQGKGSSHVGWGAPGAGHSAPRRSRSYLARVRVRVRVNVCTRAPGGIAPRGRTPPLPGHASGSPIGCQACDAPARGRGNRLRQPGAAEGPVRRVRVGRGAMEGAGQQVGGSRATPAPGGGSPRGVAGPPGGSSPAGLFHALR